jgi:hypothetical protein
MIRAHQVGADGVIAETFVVESLDAFPNLIDASEGGGIGQYKDEEGVWRLGEKALKQMTESAVARRNALLAESDFWVTQAAEAGRGLDVARKSYRQALRDLPTQDGWPENIAWPEMLEGETAPIPQSVTMRQARLALLSYGLLDDVEAVIITMNEPQRSQTQIEWEYAQTVERDNALVAALGPALGLDDPAIDSLFTLAATL